MFKTRATTSIFVICFLFIGLGLSHAQYSDDDDSEYGSGGDVAAGSTFKINGKVQLPERTSKPLSARVSVDGGLITGLLRIDGTFVIYDVPSGVHTVEVLTPDYTFDPIRIDVSGRERGKVKATSLLADTYEKMPYPLIFRPISKPEYYEKRQPWSIKPMLSNPMVWLLGGTFIMILFFQRMMANMDPAELEEMKRMQSSMSMGNILKK